MTERSVLPLGTPFARLRAQTFVTEASEFEASILIQDRNRTINAKSLLGVLSLGKIDHEIIVCAEGTDETEAVLAVSEMLMQDDL